MIPAFHAGKTRSNLVRSINSTCKYFIMINIIENRIYTKKKLILNLAQLMQNSLEFHKIVEKYFIHGKKSYSDIAPSSTQFYKSYNMLLYPYPGFHEIYKEIQTMLYECLELTNNEFKEKYYIECWLNIYKRDDHITWHSHWPASSNGWFGWYCVNVEPSITTFDFSEIDGYTDLHNENNLLVMVKNTDDQHRTWPWEYSTPRITIGFNIIPRQIISIEDINHWIPI